MQSQRKEGQKKCPQNHQKKILKLVERIVFFFSSAKGGTKGKHVKKLLGPANHKKGGIEMVPADAHCVS